MTVLAAGLALLGSLFFAVGAALQQFEAASTARVTFRHLARRPRWLLGGLAIGAGTVLHIVALRYGPLTVVQPMGVASLLFALPCAAMLQRRRPRPGELAAAAVIAIGLIGLVLVVPGHSGDPHLSGAEAVTLLAGAATVALLLWGAARGASPAVRAGLLAMGAGVLYGATATLTRVLVEGDWEPWLLPAAPMPALIALALLQRAYAVGHFGVAFAALQVADPLTAVAFGALLLGEPLPTGTASMLTALLASALTAAGTVALARTSPMSANAHDAITR
ncbi:drug/metabolite transporter (DMT)-like permease [Streptosporangium becharense]|uniref:Drug/metabolite transporter (DMT)-like permease n=1 Tax=Streptosporangium becharense TaxID=1816182 RepID=A0A7W9IEB3_9ACTN|nr:DMT family transporter [Streptosporangium becharense]MBB2910104.1 drug/metabolite transporter (DMT)-like permease [Streptosporangium becharense]MBB5818941.1 drug/metabolite transporter (DMT)-like permease [Streptosporangium becharense]